ncbi:hypothetical protein D3C77_588530 [compost metagenome]
MIAEKQRLPRELPADMPIRKFMPAVQKLPFAWLFAGTLTPFAPMTRLTIIQLLPGRRALSLKQGQEVAFSLDLVRP